MQGYCTSWPEPAPTSLRAQNMEEVGASERLESIWSKKHWRGRTPNSLCNRARHFTPDVQKKVYFLESKKQKERNAGNGDSKRTVRLERNRIINYLNRTTTLPPHLSLSSENAVSGLILPFTMLRSRETGEYHCGGRNQPMRSDLLFYKDSLRQLGV